MQIIRFYVSFAGEVYILASSKSMAQSHSGKLYKLVDPKRYNQEVLLYTAVFGLFGEEMIPHYVLLQRDKLAQNL